jgi:hypothetical protein
LPWPHQSAAKVAHFGAEASRRLGGTLASLVKEAKVSESRQATSWVAVSKPGTASLEPPPYDIELADLGRGVVQRKAVGPVGEVDVHEAARRGVAGAASRLPWFDIIQRSFGAHDVSGIQAHVDATARHASDEIGAKAYAMGSHVAFAHAPDLHTAAHEAAHVVQQRAGVWVRDGVGETGDIYEQRADAVADKVVAGESAEALLGMRAPTTASSVAVQREPKDDDALLKLAGIRLVPRQTDIVIRDGKLTLIPKDSHEAFGSVKRHSRQGRRRFIDGDRMQESEHGMARVHINQLGGNYDPQYSRATTLMIPREMALFKTMLDRHQWEEVASYIKAGRPIPDEVRRGSGPDAAIMRLLMAREATQSYHITVEQIETAVRAQFAEMTPAQQALFVTKPPPPLVSAVKAEVEKVGPWMRAKVPTFADPPAAKDKPASVPNEPAPPAKPATNVHDHAATPKPVAKPVAGAKPAADQKPAVTITHELDADTPLSPLVLEMAAESSLYEKELAQFGKQEADARRAARQRVSSPETLLHDVVAESALYNKEIEQFGKAEADRRLAARQKAEGEARAKPAASGAVDPSALLHEIVAESDQYHKEVEQLGKEKADALREARQKAGSKPTPTTKRSSDAEAPLPGRPAPELDVMVVGRPLSGRPSTITNPPAGPKAFFSRRENRLPMGPPAASPAAAPTPAPAPPPQPAPAAAKVVPVAAPAPKPSPPTDADAPAPKPNPPAAEPDSPDAPKQPAGPHKPFRAGFTPRVTGNGAGGTFTVTASTPAYSAGDVRIAGHATLSGDVMVERGTPAEATQALEAVSQAAVQNRCNPQNLVESVHFDPQVTAGADLLQGELNGDISLGVLVKWRGGNESRGTLHLAQGALTAKGVTGSVMSLELRHSLPFAKFATQWNGLDVTGGMQVDLSLTLTPNWMSIARKVFPRLVQTAASEGASGIAAAEAAIIGVALIGAYITIKSLQASLEDWDDMRNVARAAERAVQGYAGGFSAAMGGKDVAGDKNYHAQGASDGASMLAGRVAAILKAPGNELTEVEARARIQAFCAADPDKVYDAVHSNVNALIKESFVQQWKSKLTLAQQLFTKIETHERMLRTLMGLKLPQASDKPDAPSEVYSGPRASDDPVGDSSRDLDKQRNEQAGGVKDQIFRAKGKANFAGSRLAAWIHSGQLGSGQKSQATRAHNRGMELWRTAIHDEAKVSRDPSRDTLLGEGLLAVSGYTKAADAFKEGLALCPAGDPTKTSLRS